MAREQEYPEPKEMTVPYWTKTKKYDCPDCNTKNAIKHPDYICKNCKQPFKLKVKLNCV